MTAIAATISDISAQGDGSLIQAQWVGMTESDSGSPIDIGAFSVAGMISAASVEVSGTFGGATVLLKGSNAVSSALYGLTDAGGSAISMTSAGLKQVRELCRYYGPTFSGGTSQSITVTILFQRTKGRT